MPLAGAHDPVVTGLSVLVAIAASFTALDLAGRIRAASGVVRLAWLGAAAVALGGGIWSMHFVAMLAFSMPGMEVHYDLGLTLLSLVLPVLVTGLGFAIVDQKGTGPIPIIVSGLLMGAGVVAMHYTGMAAMRMRADLSYDALWVSLSVLIAIGASVTALWIAFRNTGLVQKLIAAGIMGFAISGMHYTAMQAAVFTASGAVDQAQGHASIGQTSLAFAVAGATFVLLLLGIAAVSYDRRLSRLTEREEAARRESGLAEAYRKSEEHLRLALRSGRIVAWEWNIETDDLTWSDNVVEVLGGTFGIQAAFEECVHPDDREHHQAALTRTLSEGALYDLEMRFIKPDGAVIWIQDKAELLRDSRNCWVLSGITIDITARKRAEIDAREKAASLEATLQSMDQGLLMYDAEGIIRVYNRKVLELLNLPEELLASQPAFKAVRDYQIERGEFARSDENFQQRVRINGFKEAPDVYERERPNGTVLEVRTIPLPNGGAVRTFTDITGHKQAEIQRRQAHETLASLISSSPIGIISIKTDLTIEIWNPAAERIFGYTAEEAIGISYDILVPEEGSWEYKSLLDRLRQGEVLYNNRVRRRRKDGSLVEVNASGAGLFDREGGLRGVVITLEDVTQRQQLEAQLRQSQKMEAVGQLTGGIAHDFNNLLTVMLGNAELLVETPSSPALVKTLSQQILEAAERGSDLTQHLLAFGRRHSLKPVRVSLDHVVQSMTPLLQRTIGEHIELRTDLADGLYLALTDRTLLESAILNLVVNAKDAMPQGGTLIIATAEGVAGPGQGQLPIGQDVASVTVSDTGTGMSPDVLEHVFEPFFTTKEVGKGSGLGLSMVYGFAQQSGGHVSIRSKEGEGTSVTILLPAVNSKSLQLSAEVESALVPARGEGRVLLVEDEPQVLQFVSGQLLSLGYEVTAVSTGPDALNALEKEDQFDLLFTDVVLPKGMSGVELSKRARKIRPGLKVLLTSGYSEEVFEQHGRPDEDIPLLPKPYRRKDLAETLRRVLEPSAP